MKNNQKQGNYSSYENRNRSFKNIETLLFDQKYFCFDLFPHLKSDHEKLQIIYANIRV
jgi:hypothetical protein